MRNDDGWGYCLYCRTEKWSGKSNIGMGQYSALSALMIQKWWLNFVRWSTFDDLHQLSYFILTGQPRFSLFPICPLDVFNFFSIRTDQINLLLHRFAGWIFIIPKNFFNAHGQVAPLYLGLFTFVTWQLQLCETDGWALSSDYLGQKRTLSPFWDFLSLNMSVVRKTLSEQAACSFNYQINPVW